MMATHHHVHYLTTCDSIGHTVRFALPKGGAPALVRNFRRQQGVVDAVVVACQCATPDIAPADPLAACAPTEVEALATAWAALVRQQWDAAHPSTSPQVA